jgi:hypothetical protein
MLRGFRETDADFGLGAKIVRGIFYGAVLIYLFVGISGQLNTCGQCYQVYLK